MIKAILLIFRPEQTWNGIAAANRSIAYIICLHLLPLLLLTSVVEGYGLVHWGKSASSGEKKSGRLYEVKEAVIIETAQTLVLFGLAFLGAAAAKSYSSTFHRRSTYRQAFTAIAFGMAPMLTLRLGDLIVGLFPWVPWAVGMILTLAVLYLGLPCLLKPDPPHAFGLYVMTTMTITVMFGLWRLVTTLFFLGKLPRLEQAVADLAGVAVTTTSGGGTLP
ncbi:MAG: YIP1 family protein [Verrucomicrobiota bacterium]